MNNSMHLIDMLPLIIEVLDTGGEMRIYPKGVSMLPTLREGIDSVLLVKPEIIKKYDILLYQRDSGQFVLHRVLDIDDESLVFCGDHQFKKEIGINKQNVIGRVKGIYRSDKYIDNNSIKNKLFVHLWYFSLPVRHFAFNNKGFLGSVRRRIFEKHK